MLVTSSCTTSCSSGPHSITPHCPSVDQSHVHVWGRASPKRPLWLSQRTRGRCSWTSNLSQHLLPASLGESLLRGACQQPAPPLHPCVPAPVPGRRPPSLSLLVTHSDGMWISGAPAFCSDQIQPSVCWKNIDNPLTYRTFSKRSHTGMPPCFIEEKSVFYLTLNARRLE